MAIQDRPTAGGSAGIVESKCRVATRFASIHEASCSPLVECQTVPQVQAHDLSTKDIGLVSTRLFERRTILPLKVDKDGQPPPSNASRRVNRK